MSVEPNTKVLPCGCIHLYQDNRYGTGKRVHNWVRASTKHGGKWRCTVCGRVKP